MADFNFASPPRARPVPYRAPLGTRWEKEKAAVPKGAFDFPEDPEMIGPWVIGECLGKGASGRVKVAQNCETGQMAAVKILPLEAVISSRLSLRSKDAKAEKHRNGIDKEIIMMKLMNHPNIVRIYDVFEGENDLYLILEYVDGGELFDYLVNNGKMDPLKALCYFKQIIYGLNYAHTFSIIHRDLKPENILIHSIKPPHIKIADWGMAAFAPPFHQLETSCGSPHYASPEIVNGKRYSGTATDIWSCGVILFALLTGRLPFDDKNIKILLQKVKSGKYEVPSYVQSDAADLIRRMLVVDSERRISMTDILAHPFLKLATPGITYVPAPPIEELDRPLRSPAHIKADLARSILVICVGATYDDIIPELLSPPGQGSLIKALYYLLAKHREQTLEEFGTLDEANDHNIRHYTAPPPKKSRESVAYVDLGAAGLGIQTSRNAPVQPPASLLSLGPSAPSSASPSMHPSSPKSGLRTRPPSPLGPRTPRVSALSSPKQRPISTPVAPTKTSSLLESGAVQIEDMPMEAATPSPPGARRRQRTQTVDGLPRAPLANTEFSLVRRATLQLSPVEAHPPTLPPVGGADPSWFIKAPTVENPELQRAMDDIAGRLNVLAARDSQESGIHEKRLSMSSGRDSGSTYTEHKRAPSKLRLSRKPERKQERIQDFQYSHPNRKSVNLSSGEGEPGPVSEHDKENRSEASSYKSITSGDGDGSFMKVDTDAKSEENGRDVKAKKHRSTGTRFRQSVVPEQPVAPSLHTPAVVGEFKGWFANLFNWKAQQYVLHSVDNCLTTRDEANRLLERFGCHVSLEDAQGWGILKCRFDENAGAFQDVHDIKKSVRFRVEFSPILGYNRQPTATVINTPAISGFPLSPRPGGSGGSTATAVSANSSGSALSRATARMSAKNMTPFLSSLVLVQEKGALSTFKYVYQRLRSEWGLDPLRSPEIGGGVPLMGTPRIK